MLVDSIVALGDIQGYAPTVTQSFKDNLQDSLLASMYGVTRKIFDNQKDPSGKKWVLKMFSDNFMFGYPLIGLQNGIFEFYQACHNIAHIQIELLSGGLFLRGGLAKGSVHASESLVFGECLSEKKKADQSGGMPVVRLLESARDFYTKQIQPNAIELDHILLTETDHGITFINYLSIVVNGSIRNNNVGLILSHKKHIVANIQRALSESDVKLREKEFKKYDWLRSYHNRAISVVETFRNERFWITDVDLRSD